MSNKRNAEVTRKTNETEITLRFALDGKGEHSIESGVPFLDHMLTLLSVHGLFDLSLSAKGDTDVDDHHTVEDIGICLGQALAKTLGDKSGITRYGCCYIPMDETLVRVVIDVSNRVFLHYNAPVADEKVGTFDTQLVKEFMRALAQQSGITLHIDLLHGENCHHIIEAIFKGLGRALGEAASLQEDENRVPSSKGIL